MKLKKILKKFIILPFAAIIPAASLTSCSMYDTNYITSAFYNSYDILTALGIAPKTQAYANKGLDKKYWDYMKEYIDETKTNFAVFGQSTSTPNLAQLKSFQTYTLVLNEWAKVDEHKYIGPNNSGAKHIAYTSMGDSRESKYFNETSSTNASNWNPDWYSYKEGLFSYRGATKMLANDLDKYFYPNSSSVGEQIFNSYSERANHIFNEDIKRIKNIKGQIENTKLAKKTIGIFSGQNGGGGTHVRAEKLTAIYEPFLYPQLYGPDNIGLGLKFPVPNSLTTDKTLKWADEGNLASVTVLDPTTLKEAFQNKFDYIIYVSSPRTTEEETKNDFIKFNISDFFKKENNVNLKNTTYKYEDVKDKKFVVVNYEDWYPTAWGPIGVSKLVSEIVKVLNIFLKDSDTSRTITINDNMGRWNFYDKNNLINPEKK